MKARAVLTFFAGLGLGACAVALLVLFCGLATTAFYRFALSPPTPTIRRLIPTVAAYLTPTPARTELSPAPTSSGSENQAIEAEMAEALTLMADQKFAQAILVWNRVLTRRPDNAYAHYQRAYAYWSLSSIQQNESEYIEYAIRGLADAQQAIQLEPDQGDYYLLRYRLYVALTAIEQYRADQDYWLELALADSRTALLLGTNGELPELKPIFTLFGLGRCQEGLDELDHFREAIGPDPMPELEARLLTGLAEGRLCLGDYAAALEQIEAALQKEPSPQRKFWRALILYHQGQLNEALAQLDETIAEFPSYLGNRYYLRALIHYDLGNKQQARQDLEAGAEQTWARLGLRAYVSGLLAIDDGDKETGREQLRLAEATLPRELGPGLLARIQQELATQGVSPLTPEPYPFPPPSTPEALTFTAP